MASFDHPNFQDGWHGCTTEKTDWKNPDSTPHLFFVDLAIRTNEGHEVVLERIEGGKLMSSLLAAQTVAQADKENAIYIAVRYER